MWSLIWFDLIRKTEHKYKIQRSYLPLKIIKQLYTVLVLLYNILFIHIQYLCENVQHFPYTNLGIIP